MNRGTRIGLSPSDVPGTHVTQRDLDDLARTYPGSAVWPLTPLQQGLYFQAQLAAAGADAGAVDVYVTQVVLTLGGRVDGERLRGAAEQLFARHRVMRSAYLRTGGGAVVAVIPAEVEIPWRVVELPADEPGDTVAAEIQRIVDAERLTRFDLGRPPLVRFVLVWHGDQAHLVVTNHHILMDGWSGPLVLADLLALYATGETYTGQTGATGLDFADHVRRLAASDRDAGLAVWREVLEPVEGPTLVAPGLEATDDELPRQYRVMLDEETTAGLEELTRTEGVTVATVMQFAWAVLLSRMTGSRVVVFGETVSGRPADLPGVETMVGLFINTLPSVVDVDPASTIVEVLRRLQSSKVAVMDHQHLGLAELTALTGTNQLFDTLTVHESFPIDTDALSSPDTVPDGLTDGLVVADVDSRSTTHYPINLITAAAGGRVSLQLKYLPAAFGEDQIRVFGDVLVHILETVARRPRELTADLALVSETQGLDVAAWSRGTEVEISGDHTVVDLVADARARAADRPAILFGDRVVDYTEFSARVSTLARELISLGVGPDVAVGVCIDRSVEVMVAVHAIVAAGGQYVPIDTESPVERTRYMLDTAGVALVLTGRDRPEALADIDLPVVVVDASGPVDLAVAPVGVRDRSRRVLPGHAVYTIFTSGSTGRPKGVTVTHGALRNTLEWFSESNGPGEHVFLLKTPYTFDASVWDYFGGIHAASPVVVAEPGGHRDPVYMARLIERHRVTTAKFVPSMLAAFLDGATGAGDADLGSMRRIFSGGEALSPALAGGLLRLLPELGLYNQYGPTEATVDITYGRVDAPAPNIPIGSPVWNSTVYVLDDRLRPVPPAFRARCTSADRSWHAAMPPGRASPPRPSSPIPSTRAADGSTAPGTGHGGTPTASWSTWDAPTSR